MCPRPPERYFPSKSQLHGPCMWKRNVKRPKFKPVVAFGKWSKWPFFPKNPLFWTFWPLNVPKTSRNVLFFKIPVAWTMYVKTKCQKAQIQAGGCFWKMVKLTVFSQKSTFLDILTPKCAQDLPKCLVLQNPSFILTAKVGKNTPPLSCLFVTLWFCVQFRGENIYTSIQLQLNITSS